MANRRAEVYFFNDFTFNRGNMRTELIRAGMRGLCLMACVLWVLGHPGRVIAQDDTPGYTFDAGRALEWLPLAARDRCAISEPARRL
jgi:hypothetical protein